MAQSMADAFGFAHRALELVTDDPKEFNDSEKLRSTFQVYGSLFVVLFLIYCTLRKVYPKAFTIRKTTKSINMNGVSWECSTHVVPTITLRGYVKIRK